MAEEHRVGDHAEERGADDEPDAGEPVEPPVNVAAASRPTKPNAGAIRSSAGGNSRPVGAWRPAASPARTGIGARPVIAATRRAPPRHGARRADAGRATHDADHERERRAGDHADVPTRRPTWPVPAWPDRNSAPIAPSASTPNTLRSSQP